MRKNDECRSRRGTFFDVRHVNQNVVVVGRPGECRASGVRLQRHIYPALSGLGLHLASRAYDGPTVVGYHAILVRSAVPALFHGRVPNAECLS